MIKITILLPLVLLAFSLVGSISDPWGCGCTPTSSSNSDSTSTSHPTGIASLFMESTDGGENWRAPESLYIAKKLKCGAVTASGLNNVFLIGGQDTGAASHGAIWRSTDFAETWNKVFETSSTEEFEDMAIVTNEPTSICAVTSSGSIYRSGNSGATWSSVYSGSSPLNGLAFFDDIVFGIQQSGFAVGDNGMIIQTTNGGLSWASIPSGTLGDLYDVACINNTVEVGKDTVIAVGEVIVRSESTGTSFHELPFTPARLLKAVDFSGNRVGRYGVTTGLDQTAYRTSDNGTTWTVVGSFNFLGENLEDVLVATNGRCIALGSGVNAPNYSHIYVSTDFGRLWSTAGGYSTKGYPYHFGTEDPGLTSYIFTVGVY